MNKQHILAEIRRTAETNGGKALGHREFCNVTGIKDADWSGRFWARWSDAVREAGFEPNSMSVAYTEDALLGKLAQLARELGKVPVWSEVALARRRDDTFPTEKTYRRFGGKAKLVRRLIEYCEAHPDFEDVAQLCKRVEMPAGPALVEEAEEDIEFGFVYLIKSGRHHKIGRSNAAGRREREIALQLPEKAKTVHVIRTDDPPGIEAYWHRRFAEKRLNGEWFELTDADVRAFKRRKFQ
jgi:hypothetical protein